MAVITEITPEFSLNDFAPPDPDAARRSRARQIARNLELWIPAGFILVLAGACFFWPLIYHMPSPTLNNLANVNLPPLSAGHLFGTDPLGEDVFSRILYGGRVSLEVGLGVNTIGLFIGGALGSLAGFKGGWVDAVISRIFDMFIAFPAIILAIVINQYLGPSEIHVIWSISFFSIPAFGRLSRASTLRVREQIFILSATLSGVRAGTILRRHIAPNIVAQLVTFGLLGVAVVMMVEAALSYLGYGVPPPGPSWGNMIETGQTYLSTNPDLVLIPSAFLFSAVVSLNLLGDALRVRWSER